MKVAILTNSDVGLYRFRKELIFGLLHRGHEVLISCPQGSFLKQFAEAGAAVHIQSVDRRSTNPIADARLFLDYLRFLGRNKPDVVVTYTIKPNIYGCLAARLLKVPHFATITGLGTALEHGGPLQKLLICLYKAALKQVRVVFFQNQANQKFFQEHGITSRTLLVNGSGINLEERQPFPYPEEPPLCFLFMARILQEKGIEEYLASAKHFRETYGDRLQFDVAGAVEEERYTKTLRLLHEQKVITYHGHVKNTEELYQKCHCCILPSYYPEGISNVLLEAAASGRPVISTLRPGCRETFVDGQTGLAVRERDAANLIDKIAQFLDMPREERIQMGVNGRRKIENEFNRETVINTYIEAIEQECK